jgi:hypothetical protein
MNIVDKAGELLSNAPIGKRNTHRKHTDNQDGLGLNEWWKRLQELLSRLVDHTVVARTRTRNRPTDKPNAMARIVSKNEPIYLGSTELVDSKKIHPATANYFVSLAGLPFRRDEKCRPDGVLWIGYKKGRVESPATHMDVRKRIEEQMPELSPVLELGATLFSIFQFHDPDEALNSLPFRNRA